MALVEPLVDELIDPDLLELLQFFKGPLGVIPNSIRTMSRRPEIALAFTQLNKAVMKSEGNVTPEFKRVIGFVTSMLSGCRYCQAHMALASERFGASEERLQAAFNYEGSSLFSVAEQAALAYAFAASSHPNAVDDAVSAALREHWTDDDIVEITAVVALFGYLNRWNDSMGSALEDLPLAAGDKHIRSRGWTPGKHA